MWMSWWLWDSYTRRLRRGRRLGRQIDRWKFRACVGVRGREWRAVRESAAGEDTGGRGERRWCGGKEKQAEVIGRVHKQLACTVRVGCYAIHNMVEVHVGWGGMRVAGVGCKWLGTVSVRQSAVTVAAAV
jgi:hypothetical protein